MAKRKARKGTTAAARTARRNEAVHVGLIVAAGLAIGTVWVLLARLF